MLLSKCIASWLKILINNKNLLVKHQVKVSQDWLKLCKKQQKLNCSYVSQVLFSSFWFVDLLHMTQQATTKPLT